MKTYARLLATMTFLCAVSAAMAQTLKGVVKSGESGEGVPSASITLQGSTIGAVANEKGEFEIRVSSLPASLTVSSVNYEAQGVTVVNTSFITVSLKPMLGQEIVVSASRFNERLIESPVTVERVSAATIKNTPNASYYDIIGKLKGVDVVNASLTFTSPTTRGFAGSGNTRFNQQVDGIDNQAPALNFSVGSIVGLTELDVESMELLPGASSALYGSGGMNGTLLINSKNPFNYTGLSFQVKGGAMNLGNKWRDASPYQNYALRWGQKVSEKFAYKITGEFIKANDWLARDYRNYGRVGTNGMIKDGTRDTDPNYDGINVYGDETTVNLKALLSGIGGQVPFWQSYISQLPENIPVSRTGYTENELVDPNTLNYKVGGALHYKITPKIEAILMGQLGAGTSVYTGSDRYSLRDFQIAQYKLELKSDNWFVRGYTTQENAGESHNLTATARQFNEAWKTSVTTDANGNPTPQPTDWYMQYAFAYMNAKMGGMGDAESHNLARSVADDGRPAAGSAEFTKLWDETRLRPIYQNGGLFLDKSDLYVAEGQYNFSSLVNNAVELLAGGNWRQFVLNSENTLFHEDDGPIKINEVGAYVQVGKEIIKDRLKLTAAGRYDKNEYFKGRFTPRFTAVIQPAKDHNIRLSYQTAYRFPSTQQQWIDLAVGSGTLIGGNRVIWESYDLIDNPGYSAQEFVADPTNRIPVPYKEIKPESVVSYELGYKALLAKKIFVDAYVYTGTYENFIGRRDVVQFYDEADPTKYRGISVVVNSDAKVKTFGWGMSFDWRLPSNFSVNGNLSSDEIKDVPSGFRSSFNSPKYRSLLGLSNSGFGPNDLFGFNLNWRWQDKVVFEGDFASGTLNPIHIIDAALLYKLPAIKSQLKLGANNLFNEYYTNAIGNPSIGGLYYLAFTYNL
ncbi:TonB-dependent receptor [Niabella ginsengisoli]|uniref:TonB-dependent receptor n=1 Tax=Niabella ginsengisoli TaxID=522298 RepID=A0ABS9SLA8_9BACT|nr:TonB-dependent receptor [Niabella ginsengisoli]MCH5599095.1 TonB-dependent receptor [Niabella ginsengisoli]